MIVSRNIFSDISIKKFNKHTSICTSVIATSVYNCTLAINCLITNNNNLEWTFSACLEMHLVFAEAQREHKRSKTVKEYQKTERRLWWSATTGHSRAATRSAKYVYIYRLQIHIYISISMYMCAPRCRVKRTRTVKERNQTSALDSGSLRESGANSSYAPNANEACPFSAATSRLSVWTFLKIADSCL